MKTIIMLIFILFITSCTTTKYIEVPVETIKTEYINKVQYDSIIVKDSIDRWHNGDTIYIYKEHTKFKYINKVDTIIRIDTIPKIVTVEKRVEVNHIYWYQKLLMWIGGIMSIIMLIYLTYKYKFK